MCCSSKLLEANLLSLLSEALSAHHEIVLPDETHVLAGNAARARVFAVLPGVGELLVGHLFLLWVVVARPFIY